MKRLELFIMLFFAVIIAIPGNAQNDEDVFFVVEEMPEFPGGDKELRKYIANNVEYPEEAQKNNIEGKVFVSFIVAKDGNVKDANIERGVDPSIDKEALRVINSLPKWTPGRQKGEVVNVKFTVPINFQLNNDENIVETDEDEEVMIFQVVEEMPEFPGGENAMRKFIADNVKYPESAKKEGISGKVYVSFVISKDGEVKDAKVVRGVNSALDEEALRVINSMPDWTPGKQRGKKVDVQFTLPINFALGEEK
jgi:TonB family protein